MARTISLAAGRHVPFSLSNKSDALSTVRGALKAVVETVALIAAAGRVGAAVNVGRKPNDVDLKTAGLEGVEFSRPHFRY